MADRIKGITVEIGGDTTGLCSVASFKLSTFSLLLWLHEFHARLMSLIAYLIIRLIKQVTSFIQSIIRFSGLSKDFTGVLLIPCPFC